VLQYTEVYLIVYIHIPRVYRFFAKRCTSLFGKTLCICKYNMYIFQLTCIYVHTYTLSLSHTHTHEGWARNCNTLQYTATHRIKLQHTATHCNTLQRNTMPQCNSLQHTTHTSTPPGTRQGAPGGGRSETLPKHFYIGQLISGDHASRVFK